MAALRSEASVNRPETQIAMNGDLAVAYQVIGGGPLDMLFMPNWFSNVEGWWDIPEMARWFEAASTIGRMAYFDQPGTGLSDPISLENPPSLEQWVDSARVVLDAANISQAAVIAVDGAFPVAALFAATYPGRVSALVSFDGYARVRQDDDYPFGVDAESIEGLLEGLIALWGTGEIQRTLNWDMPWNEEIRKRWARFERMMASPRMASLMLHQLSELDVRDVLPTIRTPTLVVHHADHPIWTPEYAQYIAEHIPDAKLVSLPGKNLYPVFDDWRECMDELREFLTGMRDTQVDEDRMLATVMFTDIVESTKLAAEKGDRRWRELLDAHDAVVRSQLGRFRGREVKTVGDGFLATFDGPQRAIRCAMAIRETLAPLGLEVRTGLHTGECELRGDDVGGIAVHIGARVVSEAGPSEVLVSSTVKDLVVGSGLAFEDRGARELKGVPGEWRLYAVAS
jgi:class 3 adenylate cyclase/pimeloyl-ACP methyl ester carboxylesterase